MLVCVQLLEEIGLRADHEEAVWDYFDNAVVPAVLQYQTHLIDDSSQAPESSRDDTSTSSGQQRLSTLQDLAELLCKAIVDKPLSQVNRQWCFVHTSIV